MRRFFYTVALKWIIVACLSCISTANAVDLAIGRSLQRRNFDISARWSNLDVELISEGVQMRGIPNRNRVINIDGAFSHQFGSWDAYIKAGFSCSRYGFNGSGNFYQNKTGFSGKNVGVGLDYIFSEHWRFRVQALVMRYQQVDIPALETYSYTSALLVFHF